MNETTRVYCPECDTQRVKMTGVAANPERTHAEISYRCKYGHAWEAVFKNESFHCEMYVRLPKAEAMEDAA